VPSGIVRLLRYAAFSNLVIVALAGSSSTATRASYVNGLPPHWVPDGREMSMGCLICGSRAALVSLRDSDEITASGVLPCEVL
jgi:hypothetical protein